MNILFPNPGAYILAVSGGVDSIVLLDLLRAQADLKLTVAHFDHGMRSESSDDRRFVQALADEYKIQFVYAEASLGPAASEAEARQARYGFLKQVLKANPAQAIITAHHQDDLLETAILNMLRGTGRKGLTSLRSQGEIIRPLLAVTKNDLLKYAQANQLKWREDSSNQNLNYQRNYIRHKILPRFSSTDRLKLLSMLTNMTATNSQVDAELAELLSQQNNALDRQWFGQLPHSVAKEIMAAWLRTNNIRDFDRKALERLVIAAKTAGNNKQFPVLRGVKMEVSKDKLALMALER